MSINKRALLGTKPVELGIKDAIHVAIVSLRAARKLEPGESFRLNEGGEAVSCNSKDSLGVVDPFLKKNVLRNEMFWGVLNPNEVTTVRHHWDHEKYNFGAPTNPPELNAYLEEYAKELEIPYEDLMEACGRCVNVGTPTRYKGPLSHGDLEAKLEDIGRELWYEWSSETGYEFDNVGSACCPEIDYPSVLDIFYYEKA